MNVLELFKGSGSISKYCSQYPDKYEVLSLDIDEKFKANITTDITKWDYKQYAKGHFDIIWASPPCTEYSKALTRRPRDFTRADPIVLKALEIIDYFQPTYWFIENPETGHLKTRPFMEGIPYYDVSYCKYGMPYRKQTRIWTNLKGFSPKVCKKDCAMMTGKRHLVSVGNGRREWGGCVKLETKYSIPQQLVKDIFDQMS